MAGLAAEIRRFAGSENFRDETLVEMEVGLRRAWLPNTAAGVGVDTPRRIAELLNVPVERLLGGCAECLWGVAPVFGEDEETLKGLIGVKKPGRAAKTPILKKVKEAKCQYSPIDIEMLDFEANFCADFAAKR